MAEQFNRLSVHPRHPYAGELVFTAFSGSHQDAIKKGFEARKSARPLHWQMPYLPLDPADVGCNYEAIIRVNSQSGKSGPAWLISHNHGLDMPRDLQIDFSRHVQSSAETYGTELSLSQVWQLFRTHYGIAPYCIIELLDYRSHNKAQSQVIDATVRLAGQPLHLHGESQGMLSALLDGVQKSLGVRFNIRDYSEHTLGSSTRSKAVSYVECESPIAGRAFGVAIETDTGRASVQATLNAVGNLLRHPALKAVLTGDSGTTPASNQ